MKCTRLLVAVVLLGVAGSAVAREDKAPDLLDRLKAVKGSFDLIVTFQVKKGEEATMLDAAAPCIAASRKEPGCKRYEMQQDLEDSTKFVFVERWASAKAIESHLAQPYTKKVLATLGKIVVAPPTIRITKPRD